MTKLNVLPCLDSDAMADDPMYLHHSYQESTDSTDWAILSPGVPVFRHDSGQPLSKPMLVDFITSAAPYAYNLDQPLSQQLLRSRIHRVLSIARFYGYVRLVFGARGCAAFGNAGDWKSVI